MSIFSREKKRASTKRKVRSLEDQRKLLADQTLLRNMKNDPKVLRAYIKKEHGIDIPDENDIDAAIESLMSQKEKELMEKALENAGEDQGLQEVAREAFMARLMKISTGRGGRQGFIRGREGEGEYYPPDPFEDMMSNLERVEQLKAYLGADEGGALGFLKNPALIQGIFQSLRQRFPGPIGQAGAGGNGAIHGRGNNGTVIVDVDGQLVEMTSAAFAIFKKQRDQLRIAEQKLQALPTGEQAAGAEEKKARVVNLGIENKEQAEALDRLEFGVSFEGKGAKPL